MAHNAAAGIASALRATAAFVATLWVLSRLWAISVKLAARLPLGRTHPHRTYPRPPLTGCGALVKDLAAGPELLTRILGQLPSGYALLFGRAELPQTASATAGTSRPPCWMPRQPEQHAVIWFAFRQGATIFGVFDTFNDGQGRPARSMTA
jgi:hypothetical protein